MKDDPATPEFTVSHKANLIGPRCEDCMDDWKGLFAKEKGQHLADMIVVKR